jgi:hypothetical protein
MKRYLIVRNLREYFETSNVTYPFTHLATLEREIHTADNPAIEIEIETAEGMVLFKCTGMRVDESGAANYIYEFAAIV